MEKGLIESNEATHDRRETVVFNRTRCRFREKIERCTKTTNGRYFSKFGESCEDNWHQVMNEMANSRSGFDAWISKREIPVDQK